MSSAATVRGRLTRLRSSIIRPATRQLLATPMAAQNSVNNASAPAQLQPQFSDAANRMAAKLPAKQPSAVTLLVDRIPAAFGANDFRSCSLFPQGAARGGSRPAAVPLGRGRRIRGRTRSFTHNENNPYKLQASIDRMGVLDWLAKFVELIDQTAQFPAYHLE